MKGLTKIYQDAPPLGKIILIVVACVLAYFIYKFLSKAMAPKPANENLIDSGSNEIGALQTSGEVANYTATQYNGWADNLKEAMNGMGTDEEAITNVFKYMQNKTDVLRLIKAFGIKEYTDDKLFIFNVKPLNLQEWISAELDQEEKDEYINNVLKSKNINYIF